MKAFARLPSVSLAMCLLSCTYALAQDESPAGHLVPNPAPLTSPAARITGVVICSDTQKPARGALVMMIGANGASMGQAMARTGMDGRYTLKRVPAGEYGLLGLLPGYLNPMDGMRFGTGDQEAASMQKLFALLPHVTVRDGEVSAPDLSIERGAVVSGRVLYSDGSPATQSTISVQPLDEPPMKPGEADVNAAAVLRGVVLSQTLSTDDQGHFRVAGLSPGKYTIAVQQSNSFSQDMQDGDEGFGAMMGIVANTRSLHFYSGNTVHHAQAQIYELHAGDETSGIDITIPLDALHAVRGSVTSPDGRAINGGTLGLYDPTDASFHVQSGIDAEGAYAFRDVPNGTYRVTLTGPKIEQFANPAPGRAGAMTQTMFADVTQAVIVKDGDVTLALTTGKPIDSAATPAPGTNTPEN